MSGGKELVLSPSIHLTLCHHQSLSTVRENLYHRLCGQALGKFRRARHVQYQRAQTLPHTHNAKVSHENCQDGVDGSAIRRLMQKEISQATNQTLCLTAYFQKEREL